MRVEHSNKKKKEPRKYFQHFEVLWAPALVLASYSRRRICTRKQCLERASLPLNIEDRQQHLPESKFTCSSPARVPLHLYVEFRAHLRVPRSHTHTFFSRVTLFMNET